MYQLSERKDLGLRTRVVCNFSEWALGNISELQKQLPKELRYGHREIMAYLKNENNVHTFLLNGNGSEAIGYVFGQPHNDAAKELLEDDPLMGDDPERYYVDQVMMVHDQRRMQNCLFLLSAFFKELDRRGCHKYSSHILATNGLNRYIERLFRKLLKCKRTVHLPSYGNHPFIYMEADGVFGV